MQYPTFYDQVQTIKLNDPLSNFLGAIVDGDMEITYLDCVKLAGHSCPTVAGAYLVALKGLDKLYGKDTPKRGFVKVSMRDSEISGVTGVICNVISFIVGAGGVGGFKGLNGNMARDSLVSYDTPMDGEVKLTRTDTNKSVTLSYNSSMVPADVKMQPLMGKCMQGMATPEEQGEFGRLWQERVARILLSTEQWDNMITMSYN